MTSSQKSSSSTSRKPAVRKITALKMAVHPQYMLDGKLQSEEFSRGVFMAHDLLIFRPGSAKQTSYSPRTQLIHAFVANGASPLTDSWPPSLSKNVTNPRAVGAGSVSIPAEPIEPETFPSQPELPSCSNFPFQVL